MREMAVKVKRDSCGTPGSSLEYSAMLLASDIGGTKTLLGLFAPDRERPSPIEVGEFVTLDYDGLVPMVREFLGAWKVDPRSITAACIGVAGAVTEQVARLTNVPWLVDGEAVGTALGLKRAEVINDLEALAYAVPVLEPGELAVLQQGIAVPGGNAAVIAAGTGLGIAMLHNVDGRFVPFASEGGHADFAARTPRELELVADLTRIFGRVGVELVISGPGLVNIYQFTHQTFGTGPTITPNSIAPARLCAGVGPDRREGDLPDGSTSRRARAAARTAWRRSTCSSRRMVRKRATWRCARSRPPACISAAASRPRSCRRSSQGCFSKRSARRNRWRISSPRFPSR